MSNINKQFFFLKIFVFRITRKEDRPTKKRLFEKTYSLKIDIIFLVSIHAIY